MKIIKAPFKEDSKKIKVLFISEDFSYIGGVERHLWYLAGNLDREKFELCFCCVAGKSGPMGRKIEQLGFPIYALEHKVLNDYLRSFFDFRIIFKLQRLIKNYRPDIVHVWDVDGNFLGRTAAILTNTPIIATEVTRWDQTSGLKNKIRAKILWLSNLILDCFTDIIITDSEDIRRYRGQSNKLQMIYCAFDCEEFLEMGRRYDEIRALHPNWPVIGIEARLHIQKGHRYLLEAMPEILKKFPTAQLFIVGKGPLEEELKKQARLLNISEHVVFKGEIADGVAETLCSMDVFVYPSLYEGGGPAAVLEAMAVGLPVVASNIGGINESVLQGQTGILVPPRDPSALAKAIIELLDNPSRAREMGLKGRKRVSDERFRLATYINKIENLYEELLVKKCTKKSI